MTVCVFGVVCLDQLACVKSFPIPDQKMATESLTIQGGGNAANVAVQLHRLCTPTRLVTKLADDTIGLTLMQEFKDEGVDTSSIVVKQGGRSASAYVIVDIAKHTRTCLFSAADELMRIEEVNLDWLDGVDILFLDGRHGLAACHLAQSALQRKIPIALDCERERPYLREQMQVATYLLCASSFACVHTGKEDLLDAMASLLYATSDVSREWVLTTLGARGCVLVKRPSHNDAKVRQLERDKCPLVQTFEEVVQIAASERTQNAPASGPRVIRAKAGPPSGLAEVYYCTAKQVRADEVVDSTGCGDVFAAAIIKCVQEQCAIDKMLQFASVCAAYKLRFVGARNGPTWSCVSETWRQAGR